MAKRRPKKPDWDAMERASLARAREEYRNTTPGERVERMFGFRREGTDSASRPRAKR